jgi:hypothetical protein
MADQAGFVSFAATGKFDLRTNRIHSNLGASVLA